jgi:hypothetical protein
VDRVGPVKSFNRRIELISCQKGGFEPTCA